MNDGKNVLVPNMENYFSYFVRDFDDNFEEYVKEKGIAGIYNEKTKIHLNEVPKDMIRIAKELGLDAPRYLGFLSVLGSVHDLASIFIMVQSSSYKEYADNHNKHDLLIGKILTSNKKDLVDILNDINPEHQNIELAVELALNNEDNIADAIGIPEKVLPLLLNTLKNYVNYNSEFLLDKNVSTRNLAEYVRTIISETPEVFLNDRDLALIENMSLRVLHKADSLAFWHKLTSEYWAPMASDSVDILPEVEAMFYNGANESELAMHLLKERTCQAPNEEVSLWTSNAGFLTRFSMLLDTTDIELVETFIELDIVSKIIDAEYKFGEIDGNGNEVEVIRQGARNIPQVIEAANFVMEMLANYASFYNRNGYINKKEIFDEYYGYSPKVNKIV